MVTFFVTYSYVHQVVLLREKNCGQLWEIAFLIFNACSSIKQPSCSTRITSMRTEHCKVASRGKISIVVFISVYNMDVSKSTGYKGINSITYYVSFAHNIYVFYIYILCCNNFLNWSIMLHYKYTYNIALQFYALSHFYYLSARLSFIQFTYKFNYYRHPQVS